MTLGPILGRGRTAEVYALDAERAVKRFAAGVPYRVAEREAENTRVAVAAGLPAPTVHGVVRLDGRPAIVYERVHGPSMEARLRSRPWTLRRAGRRLASLHARIHATVPTDVAAHSGLPSVRDRLRRTVRRAPGLTPRDRWRTLSTLASLSRGDALCHGDFHPGNVLSTDDGPVVIDWLDAGRGHPAADVARTTLLLRFGGRRTGPIRSLPRDCLRRWYRRAYHARGEVTPDQVREWALPVAAARLAEDVPEAARLRAFVRARLGGE
jgi:aminoglycoside phosphotransferase (APT) family kinase protein